MKKRIMVYLNENQVEAIEKNNNENIPYSKFIMECYLSDRTFTVSSKVRKRAKKRKIYVSIDDALVNVITSGNHIVNNIFNEHDR